MHRAIDSTSRLLRFAGTTPRAPHRMQGFTLVELMIVVLVLAIMLGLAAPAFRDIVFAQRVKSASFDVFSSLVMARSEAITRNTTVTVAAVSGNTNWAGGWTVTEAGGTVVRRQDAYPNVTMTGSSATVTYNALGRLTGAAGSISLTAAGVSAENSRCITIDTSGRPLSKTGPCS